MAEFPINIYVTENMKKLIEESKSAGIDRSVFVIEECAELTKELMKQQRYMHGDNSHDIKENANQIFEESCDVISTVLQMLWDKGYSEDQIMTMIKHKTLKALNRQ